MMLQYLLVVYKYANTRITDVINKFVGLETNSENMQLPVLYLVLYD